MGTGLFDHSHTMLLAVVCVAVCCSVLQVSLTRFVHVDSVCLLHRNYSAKRPMIFLLHRNFPQTGMGWLRLVGS